MIINLNKAFACPPGWTSAILPAMHSIDRKWTDLATGYQAIQSFKTKLTAEFGRAVRVGHKQQFRKELTEWQKKRRIFFALVAVAPLSIIALCLTSFYFRDVACVIIYWALLVLIILVTLAVAGRQYIREMVNGKPVPQPVEGLVVDLEGRWWESLSPQELANEKAGKKGEADFLTLLARSLSDLYIFPSPLWYRCTVARTFGDLGFYSWRTGAERLSNRRAPGSRFRPSAINSGGNGSKR